MEGRDGRIARDVPNHACNLTHIGHILANYAAFGMVESAHSHWDVGILTHAYLTVALIDGPSLKGPTLRVSPNWETDPSIPLPSTQVHEQWYNVQ